MKLKKLIPLLLLLFPLIFSSCKKDDLIVDSSAKLAFSTDSVLFDTVFHYAGSTTKVFRIYNPHDQPINISKAYLAGGPGSAFKLNIDGASTTTSNPVLHDIEILGGDSMYVFVQVFVNPAGSLPVLVKDSIIFETNGNIQDVKLTAIGQDVYLHKPLPGKFYSIMSSWSFGSPDTILPVDKPHLVFGYVVVDSAHRVIIPAGAKFYMHNHAVLWVYRDGTLEIQGAKGNEVTFQGDRLEPEYKEVPGQWGKIWLSPLSKNNIVNYAIIKNGGIGIQADTIANTTPTLRLSNTIIKNMSAAALFGQGATIRSVNCVFANCGQFIAALTIGGRYKFDQCTFANYWNGDASRTTPSIIMGNYYLSSGGAYVIRNLDSCYFGNCIIDGNIAEEIGMDSSVYGGNFKYKFDHCILKTTRNTSDPHYVAIAPNGNLDFYDISNNDYRLASVSAAIDKGDSTIGLVAPRDLKDDFRPNPSTGIPDLGAYEHYP
ncbi:MAG: right-handed parallel beta-helix repeat-containing protein [Bacteroidia bacterium]